jgi:hypothetical protein
MKMTFFHNIPADEDVPSWGKDELETFMLLKGTVA